MTVTLGCDPEFTIFGPDGTPVPAHTVGFRSSENPHNLYSSYSGYNRAFRDGFNVEVNANAGSCIAGMLTSVGYVINNVIKPKLTPGYALKPTAAFKVNLDGLMDAPDDVRMFGCSPSIDAYTSGNKYVQLDASTHEYRYAGGHLHFGMSKRYHPNSPIVDRTKNDTVVKLFDIYIGLPLSVIFNDPGQWLRRRYYGQAGEYRQQEYNTDSGYGDPAGIEYRTPPAELFNNCVLPGMFLTVGRWVIREFDKLLPLPDDATMSAVANAINTGEDAEKLLFALNRQVPNVYHPGLITKLRDDPYMHTFNYPGVITDSTLKYQAHDAHFGWGDYACMRGWNEPDESIGWGGIKRRL